MRYYTDFKPIPHLFWSFETGRPFQRCGICDRDLMIPGVNYIVEKGFSRGETAYEYAMCHECMEKTRDSFSKESRERLDRFYRERVDFEKRRLELIEECGMDADGWLSRCIMTGTPRANCGEYQIYGMFIDTDIVFTGLPYMISGTAVDEVLELLSPETLGVLGDLSDKLLGVGAPRVLVLV